MLTITKKTPRTALVDEIELLRFQVSGLAETKTRLTDGLNEAERQLEEAVTKADAQAKNDAHRIEVLETDVQNMLGTIRVMSDSSREVRFRVASMRDSKLGLALPYRNTEAL